MQEARAHLKELAEEIKSKEDDLQAKGKDLQKLEDMIDQAQQRLEKLSALKTSDKEQSAGTQKRRNK